LVVQAAQAVVVPLLLTKAVVELLDKDLLAVVDVLTLSVVVVEVALLLLVAVEIVGLVETAFNHPLLAQLLTTLVVVVVAVVILAMGKMQHYQVLVALAVAVKVDLVAQMVLVL
jgi:hypothetical protein